MEETRWIGIINGKQDPNSALGTHSDTKELKRNFGKFSRGDVLSRNHVIPTKGADIISPLFEPFISTGSRTKNAADGIV